MLTFENYINVLDEIFTIKRIVNPYDKTILDFDNNISKFNNDFCFDFRKTDLPCSNCISMRALNENKSFTKIECVNDLFYMIIATPIDINNHKYVVELVKDITEDTILSSFNNKTLKELQEEINRLNDLAIKDDLTDVFNRRYLNEQLPITLKNLTNKNFSLTTIMLDIDKFKIINDSYSYLCGDYIIKEVANILKSYMKNYNGWISRFGGDEFMIVIENISEKVSYKFANELKEIINNYNFKYNGVKINITCSFGVTFLNSINTNLTNVINDVNMKLFKSKIIRNTVS